ncbi:MAG: DUF2079 domain-containing protein [Ktedonobacteraceae bacterium]
MISTVRKHMAVWRNRLYLYPAPEEMPHTPLFWLATGLVTLAVVLFAGYFILYLTGRHDAYITSAEDLGIMDQAVWSILHGQLLHQTICNIVNDTNCYSGSGISRFAIHFEPILFPISLSYLFWPSPKTLLVIQSLVVASGAFPAFWLARLRLRNELGAVAIAVLYLLYPAQQQATVFDFHAVTLTAAFLLFTLYFMYTRKTVWLFVFAILSMACKEEIPAVILLFGLWSIVFQQRWRSGLVLAVLAAAWLGVGYWIMHSFSPVGHPLLISRYAALGNSPLQIIRSIVFHPYGILRVYVFEHYHLTYLRILLSPAGYLPLLAPWAFLLAVPSLAINLLSSEPNMHSGYFQYNAEIVPVLIFSTIEGIVVVLWIVQWLLQRVQQGRGEQTVQVEKAQPRTSTRMSILVRWVHVVLLIGLLGYVLYDVVRADEVRGALPFSAVSVDPFQGAVQETTKYQWPQTNAHMALAQHFIDLIPASASVSAQSHLVPHISQRTNIYLFPYQDDRADYIFLDVTGNTYPLISFSYVDEVKKVLLNGSYGVVAAQDGYLLLKRGLPSVGISPHSLFQSSSTVGHLLPNLPDQFCSFINTVPPRIKNVTGVTFTATDSSASALNLVGLNVVTPSVYSLTAGSMQISLLWKINAATQMPARILVMVTDTSGKDHFATIDFPALEWCPTNTWQQGQVYSTISDIFLLSHIPNGLAHVSIVLLPVTYPFNTVMDQQSWYPVQVTNASVPVVGSHANTALQVATISIVP